MVVVITGSGGGGDGEADSSTPLSPGLLTPTLAPMSLGRS